MVLRPSFVALIANCRQLRQAIIQTFNYLSIANDEETVNPASAQTDQVNILNRLIPNIDSGSHLFIAKVVVFFSALFLFGHRGRRANKMHFSIEWINWYSLFYAAF